MHTLEISGDRSANWNTITKCQDNKWGIESLLFIRGRPFLTWRLYLVLTSYSALLCCLCIVFQNDLKEDRVGQHSVTCLDQLLSKTSTWNPSCHRYISVFSWHLFCSVVTGTLLEILRNSKNQFEFFIIWGNKFQFHLCSQTLLIIWESQNCCNVSVVKQLMFYSPSVYLKPKVDLSFLLFEQEKFTVIIYVHTSLCLEL